MSIKPSLKPVRPYFASGPCAKYPGWSLDALSSALVGRSHRAKVSMERIRLAISETRRILGVPDNYLVAVTPGSATGAFEMAMWNLIGPRGVDVLAWDVFGRLWIDDLRHRLNITDLRVPHVEIGCLPDLDAVDFSRDIIFTWNGSTGGVCVPDGDWIDDSREGLTLCDATSAAFAFPLPWDKLDVTGFSWQKALGGEAAHGMLILGPRAIERLKTYTPTWPVPLLLRLKNNNEIIMPLFEGATLNTPSMLCIEDYLMALKWADNIGGVEALKRKSLENRAILEAWVERCDWIKFTALDPANASHTTVCLQFTADWFVQLSQSDQWVVIDKICGLLDGEGVACDINNHRFAFPALRIWCGPTVESEDLARLVPWIEWAYHTCLPV